jgi:hypothetical protein
MARRRWLVWMVAVAALGGCGSGGTGPGDGSVGTPSDNLGRLHEQAQAALARYDQALLDAGGSPAFIPVGDLTRQVGDWETTNFANKDALQSGRVLATTALPAAPQPTGEVAWANGATHAYPLISAEEALRQIVKAGSGDCGGCEPLQVIGAHLGTAQIQTIRGPAAAPAWEFTLKGTAVRITRVAVAGSAMVTVTPPPWDSVHPPQGLAIQSATATALAGTRLTVTFIGSPGSATQPCGADYTAEAVESSNAVVVIVVEHRHPGRGACTAIGAIRTAVADLAQPLGDRAVLEVQQGLPVPVTITS